MSNIQDTEAKWYVVHTYSSYENKVCDNIIKMVANMGLQDYILEVKIPIEEVMEVKTVTEHDTDYLLGEVDTKLKAFMEDMLENSQTLCTYHSFKYVVDALDDINNALKVVSYEIQKGFEALEAIRKIADEEKAHKLLNKLISEGIRVDKFEIKKPTLNDIFIEKVGKV